jgi:hypothetical protein
MTAWRRRVSLSRGDRDLRPFAPFTLGRVTTGPVWTISEDMCA